MGEMFLPSRVKGRLLLLLGEIEEEIIGEIQVQAEEDDPKAGPYSYVDARREIVNHRDRVTHLIDGKLAHQNPKLEDKGMCPAIPISDADATRPSSSAARPLRILLTRTVFPTN